MENAMILLYDVCRLCLDEPGVDNIFKPIDWSQDIFIYTGVKVQSDDKLPQTICPSCRDIMNCVKVLREIAERNNHRLKSLIRNDPEYNDNQVDCVASMYVMMSRVPSSHYHQDKTTHSPDISSAKETVRSTFFEGETDKKSNGLSTTSETHKSSTKRRRSSRSGSISNALKITVRKDLFDSSSTVSSSTKKSETSSSSKDLVKKLKSDTDEYKCDICKKIYATAKKLYLHQFSHNKKFTCPLDACLKKFATKGDMQKHIRSHTGEKPYKCDLCDQSFTQNGSLKAHKEKIHVEKHT